MSCYETNRTVDSSNADKDIFDLGFRDNLIASLTEDPYFIRMFNIFKAREQIQHHFKDLSDKTKFESLVCIYFCLSSELETFSQDKLKRERELEEKLKDNEKNFNFINQKLSADAANLKAEMLNASYQLENLRKDNQLLKDELEDTKTKLSSAKKKLKEVQSELIKIKPEDKEELIKAGAEKTKYDVIKAELSMGKQEIKRMQAEIEEMKIREKSLFKEKSEALTKADTLLMVVHNCKCFNIRKNQLKDANEEDGIDLDNCLSDSSLDKHQANEITDKNNKSEIVTAKIKVSAVKRNSVIQAAKKLTTNKDYYIGTSNNVDLNGPPKKSNSLSRMITVETPISKGRYLSTNSFENSRENSKEKENPQESYQSNKTVETNLDEYEINRNTSFNYGNYEVRTEAFKRYDQYYNTNYSKSPREEKKQLNQNQYGSNISTYLRAKNESVSKSSLLSHQSLIKINESYAAAEESDLDQSKDLLMASPKPELPSKTEKKERNASAYESDELEYSKSYCHTNFVFDSNENADINSSKSSEVKSKPLISIHEDMNITLGSLDEELNISKKMIYENVTTEANEYEDFNGYSEDYTPK